MSFNQDAKTNKAITKDNITYLINEKDKTASVIFRVGNILEIIIPRSITINDNEYIITRISERVFEFSRAKSIKFSVFSEIISEYFVDINCNECMNDLYCLNDFSDLI